SPAAGRRHRVGAHQGHHRRNLRQHPGGRFQKGRSAWWGPAPNRGRSRHPAAHLYLYPRKDLIGRRVMVIGLVYALVAVTENPTMTLGDLIDHALAVSPEVQAANAFNGIAHGKKQQADGTRLPHFELIFVVGPSPEARGNVVSSPDTKGDPD